MPHNLPDSWRNRAAAALDATHHLDGRGPKTLWARNILAAMLDGASIGRSPRFGGSSMTPRRALLWLEQLARLDKPA